MLARLTGRVCTAWLLLSRQRATRPGCCSTTAAAAASNLTTNQLFAADLLLLLFNDAAQQDGLTATQLDGVTASAPAPACTAAPHWQTHPAISSQVASWQTDQQQRAKLRSVATISNDKLCHQLNQCAVLKLAAAVQTRCTPTLLLLLLLHLQSHA